MISNCWTAFAGWITDLSASRQAPFLASLLLAFVSTLLFCWGETPWILVLARAFQGISGSFIYTAGLALVADSVRSDEVGSWYSMTPSPKNGASKDFAIGEDN